VAVVDAPEGLLCDPAEGQCRVWERGVTAGPARQQHSPRGSDPADQTAARGTGSVAAAH
jgi:hypothetical protein